MLEWVNDSVILNNFTVISNSLTNGLIISSIKALILLCLLGVYNPNIGHSQAEVQHGPPEALIARLTTRDYTNTRSVDQYLESIKSQYGIYGYSDAFPGAQSEKLKRVKYFYLNDPSVAPTLKSELIRSSYFELADVIFEYSTTTDLDTKVNQSVLTHDCTTPATYNDPGALSTAHIDNMQLPCAWDITQGDPNIPIGVLDVFFDETHPDLANKFISIGGGCNPSQDVCNHGFAVAGGVAAIVNNNLCTAGSGYNTRINGYCTGGSACNYCSPFSDVWPAYQDGNRALVVSCSGINNSQMFIDAVEEMTQNGTNLVVPVYGNGHNAYADIPGVIKVAQLDVHGNWIQYHDVDPDVNIDIGVPILDLNLLISPLDPDGPCRVGSGNASMAVPYLAGVIGLMLAENPCLTAPEIEILLKQTSDPITNAANHVATLNGAGALNAYEAVLAAQRLASTTITTNETWDYPRFIDGNLTIAPGAKLTITSSVSFGFGGVITVEPGGQLDVIGGHLKKDGCDNQDYWLGIEVKGNPSASQFTFGAQGRVRLIDAKIEDAKIGVSLFRRQTYAQGGGILYALRSDFKNCQKGVAIAKFTNTFPNSSTPVRNLSYIKNCNFTIDDDFLFDYGGEHIQLDRITRVNITGNLLTDSRTSYTSSDLLQNGIWSSNAIYYLDNNTIEHMRYGIKAENIKSGRTFKATNNDFRSNFFGISVRAVDNFQVTDNNFEVGEFDGPASEFDFPNRHTGMLVDQSSGFFIEDNFFKDAALSTSPIESVGLAVNNTNVGVTGELNSDFNYVSRNSFKGLYRANVANGENGGQNMTGGLLYFCNDNINNACADFTVYDGNISPIQATFNGRAAGNTFTHDNSCTLYSDFDNSNNSIPLVYHYFSGSSGNFEEPIYVPPVIFTKTSSLQNSCLDTDSSHGLIPPNGHTDVIGQYPSAKQSYLEHRRQYLDQLDNGNTNFLLSVINNMHPPRRSRLIQQLYQISPWVSTEVLLAFTEHSVPTANEKETLLTLNPDGIKGNDLNNSIQSGRWFTPQQVANIETAAQNTTTRTQLEENLRSSQAELQSICQALENYYLIDEADNGLDYSNQADWAANGESLDGFLRSIDNRLWAGDVTTAKNELSALEAMDMGTAQLQEIGYFVQLKYMEINLLDSNRDYDDVTATEISNLQTIAVQSASRSGIQAQNWLHLLGINEAQSEAYWGSSDVSLRSEENILSEQESRQFISPAPYVQVQPNPSKGAFRFHFETQPVNTRGVINIYNMGGQMVHQQIINSGNWFHWQPESRKSGFYFFTLEGESGTLLQQGKIIYLSD